MSTYTVLERPTTSYFQPSTKVKAPLWSELGNNESDQALIPQEHDSPKDTLALSGKPEHLHSSESESLAQESAKNVVIQLPNGKIIHIPPQQVQEMIAYMMSLASANAKPMKHDSQDKPRIEELEETSAAKDKDTESKPKSKKSTTDQKTKSATEELVRVNISNCDGKVEKKADHKGITINIINHNTQNPSGGLLDSVANATGLGGKFKIAKTIAGTAAIAVVAIPLAIKLRNFGLLSSLGSLRKGVSAVMNRDNLVTGMVLTSAASKLRQRFSGEVKDVAADKTSMVLEDAAETFSKGNVTSTQETVSAFKNATATFSGSTPTSLEPTLPTAPLNLGSTVETLGSAYQIASKGYDILPTLHMASNVMGMLMTVWPHMKRAGLMGPRNANVSQKAAHPVMITSPTGPQLQQLDRSGKQFRVVSRN